MRAAARRETEFAATLSHCVCPKSHASDNLQLQPPKCGIPDSGDCVCKAENACQNDAFEEHDRDKGSG